MRKLYVLLLSSLVFVGANASAHDLPVKHNHDEPCTTSSQDVSDGDLDKIIEDIEKREPATLSQSSEPPKESEMLVCDY